jgi:predicted alpha/beta-hydrolase family hydrolase
MFWILALSWLLWNMQARDVPSRVLQSDTFVDVSVSVTSIEFTPIPDTAGVALVFYPGALVAPKAYAPMAREIAEAGYKVVILKLPWGLAPLDAQQIALAERTRRTVSADDRKRKWVVGGHSRGGALAAKYARDYSGTLAGLLLVGTSHPRDFDLSGLAIDVTKVFGSEDGLASEEEVRQYGPNLPRSTTWHRIQGGNHSQFAKYGWQLGDGKAHVSRGEQHEATVGAILKQMGRIGQSVVSLR